MLTDDTRLSTKIIRSLMKNVNSREVFLIHLDNISKNGGKLIIINIEGVEYFAIENTVDDTIISSIVIGEDFSMDFTMDIIMRHNPEYINIKKLGEENSNTNPHTRLAFLNFNYGIKKHMYETKHELTYNEEFKRLFLINNGCLVSSIKDTEYTKKELLAFLEIHGSIKMLTTERLTSLHHFNVFILKT